MRPRRAILGGLLAAAACRPAPPPPAAGRPPGPAVAPGQAAAPDEAAAPPGADAGSPSPAPAAPSPAAGRTPLIAPDDPRFGRYEGPADDPCADDRDCRIGGCSREICAREPGLSTCEVLPDRLPDDARCGCVAGACRWYSERGERWAPPPRAKAPKTGPAEPPQAAEGEPCGRVRCRPPARCVRHVGIAGPNGPMLSSCEIPCGPDGACPRGTTCRTIADGPGRVCRPEGGSRPPHAGRRPDL